MTTPVGKLLRKLRIERDEYLRDMAARLNITSSYLSAIENGKRRMPLGYIERIGERYELSPEQFAQLQEAASHEQQKVEIKLEAASVKKKYAALAFARDFDKLSDDQLEEIRKIIEGDSD